MKTLKDILIPQIVQYTKARYGNIKDGGYIYLKELFDKSNIVYSYGLDKTVDTISFDIHAANLNKKIYMYDESIDSPAFMHDNFVFFKQNVTKNNFKNHVLDNNNQCYNDMVLKMDIEGSEYEVISENIELIYKHFNQITIEVHDCHSYPFNELQQKFYDCILKKYDVYHLHGNNCDFIHDGLPNVLEISFLRKGESSTTYPEDKEYPIAGLDFPNCEYLSDYKLNWWIKK